MTLAIQKASEALVIRGREGDQNAMAMICEVRENRKRGNPSAALAFDYMMRYAKRTPPRKSGITSLIGAPETSFEGLRGAVNPNIKNTAYGKNVIKFVLDMGQSVDDSRMAAFILATGRPIDASTLRGVLCLTPADIREIFGHAYRSPHTAARKTKGLKPDELKCLQLGFILGLAKRIQDAREEKTPLKLLSPSIAWELGE